MNSTHSCWLHQGIQEMVKASAALMCWGVEVQPSQMTLCCPLRQHPLISDLYEENCSRLWTRSSAFSRGQSASRRGLSSTHGLLPVL
ncbi:rCG47580, partial [Rattus norvegicus]